MAKTLILLAFLAVISPLSLQAINFKNETGDESRVMFSLHFDSVMQYRTRLIYDGKNEDVRLYALIKDDLDENEDVRVIVSILLNRKPLKTVECYSHHEPPTNNEARKRFAKILDNSTFTIIKVHYGEDYKCEMTK